MTEKRFIYCFEGIEDKWETVEEYKYTPCTKDGFQDLCDMLNKLHEENEQLKRQVKEYSMRNTVNSDLYDETYEQLEKMEKNYKSLLNENEQLKQRNTNQYNQLTELWEIIEEENWEKLIAMKKQLKEDEERLQKEWVCYE